MKLAKTFIFASAAALALVGCKESKPKAVQQASEVAPTQTYVTQNPVQRAAPENKVVPDLLKLQCEGTSFIVDQNSGATMKVNMRQIVTIDKTNSMIFWLAPGVGSLKGGLISTDEMYGSRSDFAHVVNMTTNTHVADQIIDIRRHTGEAFIATQNRNGEGKAHFVGNCRQAQQII